MHGRQNENNDLAFYAFTMTMGAVLLAVIYAYAKKILTGKREVLPAELILRNQQKAAKRKLMASAKPIASEPEPASAAPRATVAESRESRVVSNSPPPSPKVVKKREKRTGSNAEKTNAIQEKILARQQEKQLKKEQELQQAEAASKERAARSKRFRQQRAEMKAQRDEEKAQMQEVLSCSPVDKSEDVVVKKVFPSVIGEAKKQIVAHALFMAEFDYPQPDVGGNAAQHSISQTLAFLYNFHRYNMCRRLLRDKGEDVGNAVHLRTLLVHLANKVDLTTDMILRTKAQMCSFMGGEVVSRVQQYSYTNVKSDAGVERLIAAIGDGKNKLNFNSMQSLPLYVSLYELRDELNVHPLAPHNITAIDLCKWMHEKIIPYMNALCVQKPKHWQDSMRMLVIIFGEYCDSDRLAAMGDVFAGVGVESRTALANVRTFMDACRQFRNHLSHNIFDVREDHLLALQEFASSNISAEVADMAMMDDILVPQTVVAPRVAAVVAHVPSVPSL